MTRGRRILLSAWFGLFITTSVLAVIERTGFRHSSIVVALPPGRHFFFEEGHVGFRTYSRQVPLDRLNAYDKQFLPSSPRPGERASGYQVGQQSIALFYNDHGAAVQWPAGTAWTVDEISVWYVMLWWLSLPSLLVLGWQIARWVRARRLLRIGLCPNCGYDLRATPHRCPECGHIPSRTPDNSFA